MNKTDCLILTEGGSGIGMGHVTRCLSFYQGLIELGRSLKLIVRGDEGTARLLENYNSENINFLIYDWSALSKIESILDGINFAIVDSYLAPVEIYSAILRNVKKAVFLDDYNRIEYPGGFVVNGALSASKIGYPAAGQAEFLLGPAYQPLRKEFWDVAADPIKNSVENLMITFGGDDLRNLTPAVLKLICEKFPELKKHVVIGAGFKNTAEIKECADQTTVLHYNLNARQMLGVISGSDAAVTAGGQTTYELARAGVPAIAVLVADNQQNNIKGMLDAGFIEFAGDFDDPDISGKICDRLGRVIKDNNLRRKMSENGKTAIDGQGVRRVLHKAFQI